MTALEEFLAPVDDDLEPIEPPADAEQAEWLLRKVRRLRTRQAENQAVADAERRRIDEWLTEENGKLERQAFFYEQALIGWHQAILADDEKRKTISLPSGKLEARKSPDRVEVDVDLFVPWAQDNDRTDLVRVKVEPDKTAIKKNLAETGEAMPGVEVWVGEVQFRVKVEVAE